MIRHFQKQWRTDPESRLIYLSGLAALYVSWCTSDTAPYHWACWGYCIGFQSGVLICGSVRRIREFSRMRRELKDFSYWAKRFEEAQARLLATAPWDRENLVKYSNQMGHALRRMDPKRAKDIPHIE